MRGDRRLRRREAFEPQIVGASMHLILSFETDSGRHHQPAGRFKEVCHLLRGQYTNRQAALQQKSARRLIGRGGNRLGRMLR
jgi:hypothetical protein